MMTSEKRCGWIVKKKQVRVKYRAKEGFMLYKDPEEAQVRGLYVA